MKIVIDQTNAVLPVAGVFRTYAHSDRVQGFVEHRRAAAIRLAEVAAHDLAEPTRILRYQRAIQPEFATGLGDLVIAGCATCALGCYKLGGVARRKMTKPKRKQRHAQPHRHKRY